MIRRRNIQGWREWCVIAVMVIALLLDLCRPRPMVIRQDPITATLLIITAITTGISVGVNYLISRFTRPKREAVGKQEVKLTTAHPGEPWPLIYGRCGCAGQIIWRGLVTDRIIPGQSGGKRRQPTPDRHQYSASWGAGFCKNPGGNRILGISRFWFDNEEIFSSAFIPVPLDKSNITVTSFTWSGHDVFGLAQEMAIMLGSRTQLPWSYYESDPTTTYGVSAHRDLVTVWFRDMIIERFYNRLPSSVFFEIVEESTEVDDVVRQECLRGGITSDKLDTSQISGIPFTGMIIQDPGATSPASVLNVLGLIYDFSLVEEDGKLKCKKLDQDILVDIPLSDLGATLGGEEDGQQRNPQLDALRPFLSKNLPRKVEVSYLDRTKIYERGVQYAGRQNVDSNQVRRVDTNLVMTPDEASLLAKKILYAARAEREEYKFTLPMKYIYLSPGDVVRITSPNGPTKIVRIKKAVMGADDIVSIEAIRHVIDIYKKAVGTGSTGLYNLVPGLPGGDEEYAGGDPGETPVPRSLATHLVLFNSFALVDEHDNTNFHYYAACPALPDPEWEPGTPTFWKGYRLMRNTAGVAGDENPGGGVFPGTQKYALVGDWPGDSQAAVIGETTTVLAQNWGGLDFVDTTSTVRVQLINGSIASITPEQFDATRSVNLFVIGQEIVQARDVTLIDAVNRIYDLTHLRRGLRGTHLFTGTHDVGDLVVLWDPKVVHRLLIDQDQSGKPFGYRAPSYDQSLDEVDAQIFTPEVD